MKELISVIVPVYNVEDYLERCVDSIIKQTYINLEIILVDDGSTDQSGEICDKYKEKDNRIKVIHKKNGGLSSARNKGLEIAHGEYVGFVDSDDYIAEDMYEVLHMYMEEDVDITFCGRIYVLPDKKYKGYCLNEAKKYTCEEALKEVLILRKMDYNASTKLYRRKLFKNILFPVGRVSEDIPTIYRLLKRARNIYHIGKAKYFYYYRENSISHSEFYLRRIDFVLFNRDICMDIRKHYPQLVKYAEAGYLQASINMIEIINMCSSKDEYLYIVQRLEKMIRHMIMRGIINPHLDEITKKKMLNIFFNK